MKILAGLAFLVSVASAVVIIANDLQDGTSDACPSAILIFARGTSEPGNMGVLLGPPLAESLKAKVEDLWVQGVGRPYTAGNLDNNLPRGTSNEAISEAVRLFHLAHSRCPDSAVFTGGYSQGAALIAAALTDSTTNVREQVKASVLFGYTRNEQNNGTIPGYAADKTMIFCAEGDTVCDGLPNINFPAHLSYLDEALGPAPEFLASKI